MAARMSPSPGRSRASLSRCPGRRRSRRCGSCWHRPRGTGCDRKRPRRRSTGCDSCCRPPRNTGCGNRCRPRRNSGHGSWPHTRQSSGRDRRPRPIRSNGRGSGRWIPPRCSGRRTTEWLGPPVMTASPVAGPPGGRRAAPPAQPDARAGPGARVRHGGLPWRHAGSSASGVRGGPSGAVVDGLRRATRTDGRSSGPRGRAGGHDACQQAGQSAFGPRPGAGGPAAANPDPGPLRRPG